MPIKERAQVQATRYEATVVRPAPLELRDPVARGSIQEARSSKDRPVVAGRRAVVRRGIAYAPAEAPQAVKEMIWAANKIQRHPYKWGGGHGSFSDSGYDCSGTVSFALHHAGVLSSPLSSRGMLDWGQRGRGRWVTVYARNGHTFLVVAGLRLDAMGEGRHGGPTWFSDMRSTRGFDARTLPGF